MNTFLLSFLIASVTWLIIFTLELWIAKPEKKYHPPRFVDCGLGVCSGKKIYFKGLWVKPDYITPFDFNGDFRFLLIKGFALPITFHAVRGGNRDGEEWHIYQVEYATAFELIKEAFRIIDSSKQQSNERQ